MSELKGLRLSPYYLNSRRISVLTGHLYPPEAEDSLNENSRARVVGMRAVRASAEALLRSGTLQNLIAVDPDKVRGTGERIYGVVWAVFSFRGASKALRGQAAGKPFVPGSFSGDIELGGEVFAVSGQLGNDHFYSDSSVGMLTGRRRMMIAGQFQFTANQIEAFPYIIGELADEGGFLPLSFAGMVRVYPSAIDAFSSIAQIRPTKADIARVKEIPEETVKHAFAEIIGEPFVSKDWGGERSDLVSSRVTVGGKQTTAAFIFKGPSAKGTMHPANMGKRGDQLIRAFDEPADLIVTQHCDEIAGTVVKMAEALAYDPRRPRRYCIIDGADTALILKAHGRLAV